MVKLQEGRCVTSALPSDEGATTIIALADSAFAFACNSYGDNTVAAGADIEFLLPAREGDALRAVAAERWRRGRSGIYEIVVQNQAGETIALFRGRSHQIAVRLIDD